jgi:hypothetical protein
MIRLILERLLPSLEQGWQLTTFTSYAERFTSHSEQRRNCHRPTRHGPMDDTAYDNCSNRVESVVIRLREECHDLLGELGKQYVEGQVEVK